MRKTKHLNKGFSLIEIIVVLAIISILASITTVSWIRWQSHSKKRFSEDRLLYTLNGYRLLALNENLSYKCEAIGAELICYRWTFDKDGYIGWHDLEKRRIIDANLHMKITKSSPKKSHAIYFLSSGEISPFILEVREGETLLYRLKSHYSRIVDAGFNT
jgi:prepilin-type N-terminal cleavage/methylation domain-containing protein